MKLRITALFTAVCLLLPVGANQAFVSVRAMEDSPSLSDSSQIQAEATLANWKLAVTPDPSTGVTTFTWTQDKDSTNSYVYLTNDDTKKALYLTPQTGIHSVVATLAAGNYTASLNNAATSNPKAVDTVKFKVGETKPWTYCSVLPTDISSANAQIEYNAVSTKVAKQSPGDGWVQGALAKTEYENSGATYESDIELPTSETRVLLSYYYYHFCGPSMGNNANYTQTDQYVHWDALNANDVYVVDTGLDKDDTRYRWYYLKWNGTNNWAYCQSGVTCDGSFGTHGARTYVWYRRSTYQDKVAVNYYNYTYASNTWSASNPASGASSVRYTALNVSPTETTTRATTATTLATTATTRATTATTPATTVTTRATTATTPATTVTTRATTATTRATTATTLATAAPSTTTLKFAWGSDNWNFNNEDNTFNYSYAVKSKTREQLRSDFHLSNIDMEQMNQILNANANKQWMGSCFGMTVTEIMVKQGDLNLTRYNGVPIVNQNSPNADILSLINAFQGLQNSSMFVQAVRENALAHYTSDTQPQMVSRLLQAAQENALVKASYQVVDTNRNTSEKQYGGHAVIVYGVQKLSTPYKSDFTNKSYDMRFLTADPNHLKANKLTDEACIYFNSTDNSWIVPYLCKDIGAIRRTCYWNAGTSTANGKLNNIMRYSSANDRMISLMSDYTVPHYIAGLNINNSGPYDTMVEQVKNTGNPNLDYADTGSSIVPYQLDYETLEMSDQQEHYALWNPTADYEVSYTHISDFSADLDYENVSYNADFQNVSYVLFKPSGNLVMRGSDADYTVNIVTNEKQCLTDWYCVSVSGNDASQVQYQLYNDNGSKGYLLTADNLKNITVNAHNDRVSPSVQFSTTLNRALIYEINESAIGIAVDTDNNGSFETTIAQSDAIAAGDVTGDGSINAKDANAILIAASKLGTGKDSGLTAAQNTAADVNGDGMINAKDANIVLRYAAAIGTGSTAKLTDFI